MAHENHASCIAACNACADACDHCAASCLQEDHVKMMTRCIALDLDCAQTCRLAASVMARDSEMAHVVCELCADICDACAAECARHPGMEHCQACATACRRCAEECRAMVGRAHSPTRDAVPA